MLWTVADRVFAALAPIYRQINDPSVDCPPTTAAAWQSSWVVRRFGRSWRQPRSSPSCCFALRRGHDSFYPAMGGSCLITLLPLALTTPASQGTAIGLITATALGLALARSKSGPAVLPEWKNIGPFSTLIPYDVTPKRFDDPQSRRLPTSIRPFSTSSAPLARSNNWQIDCIELLALLKHTAMIKSRTVPLARIVAFSLAIAIVVLSVVPPSLRPETALPHDLEHFFRIYFGTGLAFAVGYQIRPSLLVLLLVIFCAAVEVAQLFIPGRHARLSDFVVDALAVTFATMAASLYARFAPWFER